MWMYNLITIILARYSNYSTHSNKLINLLFLHIYLFYSHLVVVVTTDQSVIPYKVPDNDLLSYNESMNNMYVTAVVYNASGDQWEKKIVIGNGNMYNYKGMMYYNAPLDKSFVYYSFVRAYSYNHNDSVSFMIIVY